MRINSILSKGQRVQIADTISFYNNEVGEVLFYDAPTDKYIIRLDLGYVISISKDRIIKQFTKEELLELYKGQLMQLADLALEIKDREWFGQICTSLNKLNNTYEGGC